MSQSSLNGKVLIPEVVERPIRFVFVVESIVSAWNNPFADPARRLATAIQSLGHEVWVLEERLNEPTRGLLREHGSSAIRDFANDHPDLHYRTFELPTGTERTVWLVQQTATAHAFIVQDRAAPGVLDSISQLNVPTLVRGYWSTDPDSSLPPWPDIVISSGRPEIESLTVLGTDSLPEGPQEVAEALVSRVKSLLHGKVNFQR